MRSAAEIRFRLAGEICNVWFWLASPGYRGPVPERLPVLPDPGPVAAALRGTAYERELLARADAVLAHRFPLFGLEIETGPEIAWRRDYVHGIETGRAYFRRIPYLDKERAGDHKMVWELNRHQHLVLLAQAWRLSGRHAYRDEIAAQLESWFAQNPFQCGMNWTSALEVGFRALSWIWVYHLAGEALTAAQKRGLVEGLYRHGLHLERNLSVYFSPNTHLLGEALALEAIGLLFPCFAESGRWAATGGRIVAGEMERQVLADGAHFEQSTYYHVYAFDMFLFHLRLTGAGGGFGEKLDRMGDYLEALLGTDRAIVCFGDDDGGRFFHPYGDRARFGRASLAAASLLRGGRWGYEAADVAEMAAWWVGADALAAVPPPVRPVASRLFAATGMGVLADGETVVYMDAGPFGPFRGGHSHADTLSIAVKRGGREVLIDPGTYTYVGDPEWRNRFRGTAAHNTVRIGGRDQADPAGPFGWTGLPEAEVTSWRAEIPALEAVCRYRGLVHRRRVSFDGGRVVIADTVEGEAVEKNIELFWHCGAAVTAVDDGGFRIGEAAVLRLPGGMAGHVEEGWRSAVLGSKSPAPVIRAVVRARLPWRGETVVAWQ